MKNNLPFHFKKGEELDDDLAVLGMNLSHSKTSRDPDIEQTLLACSIEAIDEGNSRNGALLVDWISVHYPWINVDRLMTSINSLEENKYRWVKIFWCANAQRLVGKDIRFRHLANMYKGPRLDFADRDANSKGPPITEMFLRLHGEDERFSKTCIRVPKNIFPHRPQQIFSANSIARRHMGFRFRVIMGPSYRADVWALLKRNPTLTGYRLAQLARCSRSAATKIKQHYEIVRRDNSKRRVP